jgi:large subunit ribosomal protein L4
MNKMIKLKVKNIQNEDVGEIELPESVYESDVNDYLISFAVKHDQAAMRAGTASTKVRHQVRGSGRKPWRQKGTGRARIGERSSPVWRGGGTVFGPKPRSFAIRLPRKMRQHAMRSALSLKLKDNQMTIVDSIQMEKPKTKVLGGIISALGLEGKVLVVDQHDNQNLALSARNNPNAKMVAWGKLSVFDILKYDQLVLSSSAARSLGEVLSR